MGRNISMHTEEEEEAASIGQHHSAGAAEEGGEVSQEGGEGGEEVPAWGLVEDLLLEEAAGRVTWKERPPKKTKEQRKREARLVRGGGRGRGSVPPAFPASDPADPSLMYVLEVELSLSETVFVFVFVSLHTEYDWLLLSLLRKTFRSAVVMVPPLSAWPPLQAIRRIHDTGFVR